MNPLITLKEEVYTQVISEDSVGSNKRRINRINEDRKAIRKGMIIFEKLFPKAFLPSPYLVDFETQWEKFFLLLTNELPGKKSLVVAHNRITKAIDLGTKKGLWSVSIPTQITLLKREKPFKNQKWFQHAKILQEFESHWLSSLNKTDDSYELLIRCIYSALFHSGFPFSTNNIIDKKEVLTSRFYPTTITLAFIYKYFNNNKQNKIIEPQEFWKVIINKIKVFSGVKLSERQICHAAVSISEIKPNVSCPEAIIEYMTKRNMSYSLPCDNWDKIGENQAYIQLESITSFKSLIGDHRTKEIKAQPVKSTFGLIADLRNALATHKNNKH